MNQEKDRTEEFSGRRLREILTVLKKNHITNGIDPPKLCSILEDLGPTYVKLGQIMSMRSDLLPERYCKELVRLRTEVKPMDFDVVLDVVAKELDIPINDVFSFIDSKPLGSASIAQVHKAVLKNGSSVALKVQRPGIKETMAEDIALMKKASGVLNFAVGIGDLIDFRSVIDELWETSKTEMDFIKEADHLELFYNNQKDIRYISCPKVYRRYSSAKLLVMSYVEGVQIDEIDTLERLGYDMSEIGRKSAENYCKQILEDGFFHADPHPGNLWISDGTIAWLDLGMAGHLSDHYKSILKRAISAILKNDIYELKNAFLSFGNPQEKINHAQLYTDLDDLVGRYMNLDFGTMNLGELMEDFLDILKSHKIAVTSDITLLARSMITMEGTLKICSPNVNMLQILTTHMSSIMVHEFDLKKEMRHSARDIYSSSKKSLEIPAQLSDLLNITKNGQIRLNIESSETKAWREQLRHHANHFVLTALSAVFWISSALLCLSDISPKIFQMPWLSAVGFCIGSVFILYLLIDMVIFRRKCNKKLKK
jgi:ubiquinone biosynthesis protein